MEGQKKDENQIIEDVVRNEHLPLEKPISAELTPFLGDVLQSWNFLWRFHEVLGLRKGFSFEELTTELNGSLFDGLSETHILMLQVLISEFQMKLEHGSKRHVECLTTAKRIEMDVPPLNDLTWPELVRRYVLAIMFMTDDPDSAEVREGMDMFRCLYGDGGRRCGALTGVVGLEADAWLLAAAINKIYGSLYDDGEMLSMDDLDSKKETMSQKIVVNEEVPGWVQELEPIKKLKTNVGSKIRNCINNSLAKEPPEWAREVLDHSISKEVYKGNASGPTKKLALSVVAQFCSMRQNLTITKNRKDFFAISNVVMKQCRIVLRRAALAKETKDFCTLINERYVKHGNYEEGVLGSPAIVSSLLYFRMVDMRLAAGAYCRSHEAFAEDMQEFWRNVLIAFGNDSQLVDSAKKSCHVFESLYDKEVVALHQKLVNHNQLESSNDAANEDIENSLVSSNEIQKASWDEGVCRACGIDENDKKVLLCDTCDAEYHTYCLRPPLAKVPKGNWFCSFCVPKDVVQDANISPTSLIDEQGKKRKRDFINFIRSKIADLAAAMSEKDYWELSLHERTFLLKFICDEMLGSALMREHLMKCESSSNQHKNSNCVESQALRDKENILSMETGIGVSSSPGISEGQDAPSDHITESAPAPSHIKLISATNEVLPLEDSSVGLGTAALKSSLRSEFLGIDSAGKLYWIIYSGANPWIIVNKVDELHKNGMTSQDSEIKCLADNTTLSGMEYLWSARGSEAYSSWACYQSDVEIKRLMDSLKDNEPIKRQLEDTFLQRHKVPTDSQRENQTELHPSLLEQGEDNMGLNSPMTRATKLLELKYGPFVKLETTDLPEKQNKGKAIAEDKMYRCECLEPILPAEYHCLTCHRTYFSTMEFKLHGNGKCNFWKKESSITLHGEGTSKSVAGHDFSIEKQIITSSTDGFIAPNSLIGSTIEVDETQTSDNPGGLEHVKKASPSQNVTRKLEIEKLLKAPVSSVRPLIGRAAGVLTQLKVNLLDMEAAVPKDAFRSSKACIERRRAWRMFIKCASTIHEMVQAVIVFEDMIKLEYIDYSWRKYWSFSAAANISTLAALSLRIYSLDAAINYEKISSTSNSVELLKKTDKGKGRQNLGPIGRPRKKQKEELKK